MTRRRRYERAGMPRSIELPKLVGVTLGGRATCARCGRSLFAGTLADVREDGTAHCASCTRYHGFHLVEYLRR